MLKKAIKLLLVLGMTAGFIGLVGYLGAKAYYVGLATKESNDVIEQALSEKPVSADDEVIALAKYVFEHFRPQEPSEIKALRLRPYVTNGRLPEFLRFPDGAIEMLVGAGLCDNAARMLAFILKQRGYESVQWNMVTPFDAHSALLVSMPDGRKVFADPFYGYVAYDQVAKKLLSPHDAQNRVKEGAVLEDVFISLASNAHPEFYKNFGVAFMAAQGSDLMITAALYMTEGKPVLLGENDGSDEDVKHQAGQNGMTPFWHYVGHKYNREWVRVLQAQENVRLEMLLMADAEEGIITSDPRPKIEGRKLIWNLKAGDRITFRDGLAAISFRRLNSYIGVDQIALYPVE